jgi:hypothetical protein
MYVTGSTQIQVRRDRKDKNLSFICLRRFCFFILTPGLLCSAESPVITKVINHAIKPLIRRFFTVAYDNACLEYNNT